MCFCLCAGTAAEHTYRKKQARHLYCSRSWVTSPQQGMYDVLLVLCRVQTVCCFDVACRISGWLMPLLNCCIVSWFIDAIARVLLYWSSSCWVCSTLPCYLRTYLAWVLIWRCLVMLRCACVCVCGWCAPWVFRVPIYFSCLVVSHTEAPRVACRSRRKNMTTKVSSRDSAHKAMQRLSVWLIGVIIKMV